jgi:hypothetical protein
MRRMRAQANMEGKSLYAACSLGSLGCDLFLAATKHMAIALNDPLSGIERTLPQRLLIIEMLKLPPPIWALVYVLIAAAISWFLGWSKMPGFPLVSLGISLIAISWILPVWAIVLFRREGTEVEPTSVPQPSSVSAIWEQPDQGDTHQSSR